jgi:hypothetical protein
MNDQEWGRSDFIKEDSKGTYVCVEDECRERCASRQLQELNVSILQRQVNEHRNRGRSSRARLQIGGALTVLK